MGVAAVAVLIVALQMDYGSARRWLTLLAFALGVLAIDPMHLPKMIQRRKVVANVPEEPDYVGFGYLNLTSAIPVDRIDREKWLNGRDVYLQFLDIESDGRYYMHFVDGKVDETYIGGWDYLESLDFDEVFEGYETVNEVLQCADNEEIEDLCLISSDDFLMVRHYYHDSRLVLERQKQQEQHIEL